MDGEGIDALPSFEKGLGRVVDPLMPRDIEVVDAQQVGHFEDGIAVDEQTSENLLLGAFVKRDLAVGRARLDGHAG